MISFKYTNKGISNFDKIKLEDFIIDFANKQVVTQKQSLKFMQLTDEYVSGDSSVVAVSQKAANALYNAVEADISNLIKEIEDTEYVVATTLNNHNTSIEALTDTQKTINTSIIDLSTLIQTANTSISSLNTSVSSLNTSVAANTKSITSLNSSVLAVTQSYQTLTPFVNLNTTNIAKNTSAIESLDAKVAEMDEVTAKSLNNLAENVSDLQDQYTTLVSDINDTEYVVSKTLNDHEKRIKTLETEYTAMDASISEYATLIAEIQNLIKTINTSILDISANTIFTIKNTSDNIVDDSQLGSAL